MMARSSGIALALVLALAACGPSNPVLGEWQVDRQETEPGALLAVQAAELESLSFDGDGATSGATEIPGEWIVEQGRVRLVRADGAGEHAIEVLSRDQIKIELPIGVTAVYVRKDG